MKRLMLFLLLVFITVLALPGPSHAVQLQQGWYAEFAYIVLGGSAYPDQYWDVSWYATSPTGQFGPLTVAASSPATSYGRRLTISQTAEVASGMIFEDWGTYSSSAPYYDQIRFSWRTNYDARVLQLRMYQHRSGWAEDQLLWTQSLSEAAVNRETLWTGVQSGDSVVFRLVVVPEPSGLSLIATGLFLMMCKIRRRRLA